MDSLADPDIRLGGTDPGIFLEGGNLMCFQIAPVIFFV